MTKEQSIDLSVIDATDIGKLKNKQQKADRVIQVIKENGLDKDKEFMDEINPLVEELLKEAEKVERIEDYEE